LLITKLPCVGRDIEKEGKGYYEDTRPASNMDLYVATSMIVETTILWKPWESQAIPQTK
jgi:glutamine synthetase